MRNPNRYGCIKKLSGQRRRPFAFVVSENGKQRFAFVHRKKKAPRSFT